MKLSKVSINNYRSIKDCNISLTNHIILLGKNNEGKTNIIRSIKLCMDVISSWPDFKQKKNFCLLNDLNFYNYNSDHPLKNVIKEQKTNIVATFEFSKNEIVEVNSITKNFSGDSLSISISFSENNTARLQLNSKSAITANQICKLCKYISNNFDMQWIPAIRSKKDVYETVDSLISSELNSINDKSYQKYLNTVENRRKQVLSSLARKAKKSLQKFMPSITDISISTYSTNNRSLILKRYSRLSRSYSFKINDGVLTDIENKGDGVISLTTIALLSQLKSTKSRLIIVDEPENHLHPDAIRYINSVMIELSKKHQVVISTHSPILVNRNSMSSNIIVQEGQAMPATQIQDIRKTLGVVSSDNLTFPEYVVLVEGKSDQLIFNKLLRENKFLANKMDKSILGIKNIGGVSHLSSQIEFLELLCSKYFAVLDNDGAGREARKHVYDSFKYVAKDNLRCINIKRKGDSELEDLYNENFYSNYLQKNVGVSINDGHFKNITKKWSDRVNDARRIDHGLEEIKLEDIKNLLAEKVESINATYFTKTGLSTLRTLRKDISKFLKNN